MANQVAQVMRELERFVERLIGSVAIEVTHELVRTNPVDTGYSRASWIPTTGAPTSVTAGARPPLGSYSSSAQSGGLSSLRAYSLHQGNVYVTNNVDYIGKLNDGWSPQAPPGFVQIAMLNGITRALRGIP